MDGERFDRVAKAMAVGTGRRRLMAGLVGTALTAALGRRGAAARSVGAAGCRERLAHCDRREQCCEAAAGRRFDCARVSEHCRRAQDYPGGRCCGERDAVCSDDCDCCRGFACLDGRCRSGDRTCRQNFCCGCFRCQGDACRLVGCTTGLTFRECIERCGPDADAVEGVSGRRTTFACGAAGRCKVVCEDRHAGGQQQTFEWRPAAPAGRLGRRSDSPGHGKDGA